MLKYVEITNYLGKMVRYTLESPTIEDESGLFITGIDGLGPVKATINMTELATADGDIYNSSRLSGRNIVINGRFTYAKTIEEARLMSYKFFPIGHKVKFVIKTDNRLAETEGYVESNEPNIFSSDEDVQISILCESPWFTSAERSDRQHTDFAAVESMFEFPFSNESLDEKLIIFGKITNKKENSVYYEGDSETGCIIHLHAIGTVRNIDIYNIQTAEHMGIDTSKIEALTGSGIIYGDDITITTIKGRKSIMLLREGVTYNILNALDKNVDWFQLARGDNLFAFTCEYGEENLQFMIESQIIFEGV